MDNPSSQLYEIVNLLSSFCAVQQTANASISALQDGLFGKDRQFETNFPLNTTLLLQKVLSAAAAVPHLLNDQVELDS